MPIPVQPLEASIVHYSTCVMQTCVAPCIVFVRVSRNDVGMRGLGNNPARSSRWRRLGGQCLANLISCFILYFCPFLYSIFNLYFATFKLLISFLVVVVVISKKLMFEGDTHGMIQTLMKMMMVLMVMMIILMTMLMIMMGMMTMTMMMAMMMMSLSSDDDGDDYVL